MATAVKGHGGRWLPDAGTFYYDYLVALNVGTEGTFELFPDREALNEELQTQSAFVAKKIGVDLWDGVPNQIGAVSSRILFEHVREQLLEDEQDTVVVSIGDDPMKVKKEYDIANLQHSDHPRTLVHR